MSIDGRFMADGIQTASTPEKKKHPAECTPFGPEETGGERTDARAGTGKDTKGRGK